MSFSYKLARSDFLVGDAVTFTQMGQYGRKKSTGFVVRKRKRKASVKVTQNNDVYLFAIRYFSLQKATKEDILKITIEKMGEL